MQYLRAWEKEAKEKNYEFITESTCYGLKISLKAALEICTFLVQKCDFIYLMTARLNQDNLEVYNLFTFKLIDFAQCSLHKIMFFYFSVFSA